MTEQLGPGGPIDEAALDAWNEGLDAQDTKQDWRRFQVHYAPARRGPYAIENYEIPRLDPGRLGIIGCEGWARDPGWGKGFTRLVEWVTTEGGPDRQVWMSDSKAEVEEHYPLFNALFWTPPGGDFSGGGGIRVLINGLGLGVAVHGALTYEGVTRVDVVEINPDIAALVVPLIDDPRVVVHIGDAYEMAWPPGARWDVAWHDIWPDISDGNLPLMSRLHRKYARRVGWQSSWQIKGCRAMARIMAQAKAGTLPPEKAAAILAGAAPWAL